MADPPALATVVAEQLRLHQFRGNRRTIHRDEGLPATGTGQVQGFDEAKWQAARYDIVVRGNLAKFSQNEALRSFLLNTGERVLVEASPVDPIWGIGLAANDPLAEQPAQWRGLNLLGFALMDVRRSLRVAG